MHSAAPIGDDGQLINVLHPPVAGPSYGLLQMQYNVFSVKCFPCIVFRQVFSVKCFPAGVFREVFSVRCFPPRVFRQVRSSEMFVTFQTVGFQEA